jgi:hypothetical protein
VPTCLPLPSSGRTDIDIECARDLPKLEVRLVVRADGDGVRITVLVGPTRHELSAFIIHSDLLAVESDLAKAVRAIEFMNMTLEPGAEQKPYPFTRLEGRVKVALQKLGPKKVRGSYGVLEAITVEGMESDSDPVSLRTAASDPLFAVTADGVAKELSVKLAVGQTDVKTSWDPKDTGARNLDLHVSIGGYHGELVLTEAKKEVVLRGLGIGQTFVAVRGTHIFDLDLNPGDGRKFDVKVLLAADDRPRFELSPKFDLALKFSLGAIAADFTEPPPSYLAGETYSIKLDGASPAVFEAAPSTPDFQGGLKIVAGTLTIATTGQPATSVVVPAGQCLTNQQPADMSHPILGGLVAASCP